MNFLVACGHNAAVFFLATATFSKDEGPVIYQQLMLININPINININQS